MGRILQLRPLGMETQRSHRQEVPGLVLKLSELDQMVHALFVGLDMAIQHRRILLEAQFGSCSGHHLPLFAVQFLTEQFTVDALTQYLYSAARKGVEASLDEIRQRLVD